MRCQPQSKSGHAAILNRFPIFCSSRTASQLYARAAARWGKQECGSDGRDPPVCRDPCHGFVRVCYQTMGITAGEIGNGTSPPDPADPRDEVDGGYGATSAGSCSPRERRQRVETGRSPRTVAADNFGPSTRRAYRQRCQERHGCRIAAEEGAGSFKRMDPGSRQSKVDRKAAAQSREALRSSSRQRLVLMAWRLCRWRRPR